MAAVGLQKPRVAREHFSQQLAKVCQRLDAYHPEGNESLRVERLWAVGSWARGAPLCGDLDLVIAVAGGGIRNKTQRQQIAAIIGRPRGVEIHFGNPKENSSGVAFEDHVLVWSGHECDWRGAIAAVPVNPEATRAPRVWDALPFAYKDFSASMSNDSLLKLIEMEKTGVIRWAVKDMAAGANAPPGPDEGDEFKFATRLMRGWGASRQGAMLAMLRSVLPDFRESRGCYVRCIEDYREFLTGGVSLRVGPVYVRPKWLMDSFNSRAVCFAKLWSNAGPNWAWVIERGPNHPLNIAFAEAKFWTICRAETGMVDCEYWASPNRLDISAGFMHLLQSEEAALEQIENMVAEEWAEVDSLKPRLLEGANLLDALTSVDGVENLAGEIVPLTTLGQWCAGTEAPPIGLQDVLHWMSQG